MLLCIISTLIIMTHYILQSSSHIFNFPKCISKMQQTFKITQGNKSSTPVCCCSMYSALYDHVIIDVTVVILIIILVSYYCGFFPSVWNFWVNKVRMHQLWITHPISIFKMSLADNWSILKPIWVFFLLMMFLCKKKN